MPVQRDRDGGFRVRLGRDERALLRRLADELRGVVEGGDDPALARLFPRAYEDEGDAAEFDRLVRPGLVEGKLAAAATLARTADAERLTQAEVEAWLAALNDLRLILGERLGVTEEVYERAPPTPGMAVYGWLTWIEGEVVEALAAEL